MTERLVEYVVNTQGLLRQNLHRENAFVSPEYLAKLVETYPENYPFPPQGFSLERVAQISANDIYETAQGGMGTEEIATTKNQEKAFRAFIERLLETLMIGNTDKYLRTLETIWVIRRTSRHFEPFAKTNGDEFHLNEQLHTKSQGIFSSQAIDELAGFPRNPTIDWIIVNVIVTSWLTKVSSQALTALYGENKRLDDRKFISPPRTIDQGRSRKSSRLFAMEVIVWLIGQSLIVFDGRAWGGGFFLAVSSIWWGTVRLVFTGLRAFLIRVIEGLKSKPYLSSGEERTLASLSNITKPVFLEFSLSTKGVETNCRRYISEIVKLKSLTEDFKYLDPVAIHAQFERVRNSFPTDLLELEQNQFLQLAATDLKSAKLEGFTDLDSLEKSVECAKLKYPSNKFEGAELMSFLIDRAKSASHEHKDITNAWGVIKPVNILEIRHSEKGSADDSTYF